MVTASFYCIFRGSKVFKKFRKTHLTTLFFRIIFLEWYLVYITKVISQCFSNRLCTSLR